MMRRVQSSTRQDGIGRCERCSGSFPYALIHNGFNQSTYAYCDACGRTALLDAYKLPSAFKHLVARAITSEAEVMLLPCMCGGRFTAESAPRCPACQHALSPRLAAGWLEANAPGTKTGWR